MGVSYILVKDGEFRIDLLDGSERGRDQIARLEALDEKLSGLGVALERAPTAGLLQGRRSAFVAGCRNEIEERYPADIAPRLINLLQVDRFAGPQN